MDKVNLNGVNSLDQLRSKNNVEKDRSANESRTKITNSPLNPSDEISVSDRGASIQQIVEKISDIPQVRQERVEALRQQIHQGNFNPSAKDIADAILRDEN